MKEKEVSPFVSIGAIVYLLLCINDTLYFKNQWHKRKTRIGTNGVLRKNDFFLLKRIYPNFINSHCVCIYLFTEKEK